MLLMLMMREGQQVWFLNELMAKKFIKLFNKIIESSSKKNSIANPLKSTKEKVGGLSKELCYTQQIMYHMTGRDFNLLRLWFWFEFASWLTSLTVKFQKLFIILKHVEMIKISL